MNKYLLQFRHNNDRCWSIITGEASTEASFLENQVRDKILRECEWTVHELVRSTSKKEYNTEGMIDNVLPEDD